MCWFALGRVRRITPAKGRGRQQKRRLAVVLPSTTQSPLMLMLHRLLKHIRHLPPWLWRTTAWALAAAILTVSLVTPPDIGEVPGGSDKVVHVAMYAILSYAFVRAYPAWHFGIMALVLMGYGAGIEIFQGFTADRHTSLADAIANSVGVGLIILAEQHQQKSLNFPS